MNEMNRMEAIAFIKQNVLGSTEVQELLMVNKQRLKALVDTGKLTPIKELKERLFLLADVEKLMKEMMLDSRTNLAKGITKNGILH